MALPTTRVTSDLNEVGPAPSEQRLYRHTSLDRGQIRLITLHPAEHLDAAIEIDIHHHEISDRPRYQVVSYTWEDTDHKTPVSCSDVKLFITTGLWDALSRLRRSVGELDLWVDELCINHLDDAERGVQIAMMREITQMASRTVIWLGRHADDSEMLMSYHWCVAGRLSNRIVERRKYGRKDEDEDSVRAEFFFDRATNLRQLFDSFDPWKIQRALAYFLARPWFRSAWAVQQYVLSDDIYVLADDDVVDLNVLISLFDLSFTRAKLRWTGIIGEPEVRRMFCDGLLQLLTMHDDRQEYREGFVQGDMSCCLGSYRSSRTARPEDKIWSLLAVPAETAVGGVSFHPLYGLPKPTLYTEVATQFVRSGHGTDILTMAVSSPRRSGDMPSWVPDWDEPVACTPFSSQCRAGGSGDANIRFTTGGSATSTEPRQILRSNGMVTHVIVHAGNIVDAKQVTNVASSVNVLSDLLTLMENWPTATYVNGEELSSVLETTCRAGQTNCGLELSLNLIRDISIDLDCDNPSNIPPEFAAFVESGKSRSRLTATTGRRAAVCLAMGVDGAISSSQYLGLIPHGAQVLDLVCILEGYRQPLVLRQTAGRGFTLVGDCYVHGIMNGELADRSEWDVITIL